MPRRTASKKNVNLKKKFGRKDNQSRKGRQSLEVEKQTVDVGSNPELYNLTGINSKDTSIHSLRFKQLGLAKDNGFGSLEA